jgi:hypothetical protein
MRRPMTNNGLAFIQFALCNRLPRMSAHQSRVRLWKEAHPALAGIVGGGRGWFHRVATIVSPCHLFVD